MDRVRTLIWLRWRIWRHGLRTTAGATDVLARVVMNALGLVGSLAITAGAGMMVWLVAHDGDSESLETVVASCLYVTLFFGVVVPLFVGGVRTALELRPLAPLPISAGALYRLSLAASSASANNLFWYPALAAVGAALIIATGADPVPSGLVLLAMLVVNVIWSHTLLHLIGLLLGRRRARELATIVALVVLVMVSVIPAAVEGMHGEDAVRDLFDVRSVPSAVIAAIGWLPPSLAADGLLGLAAGRAAPAVRALAWLGVWAVVGVAVGWRLFRRQLLDPEGLPGGGAAAADRTPGTASGLDLMLDRALRPALAAIAGKNLRYLFRSTLGKLALVFAPIISVIAGFAFAKTDAAPVLGIDVSELTFIGMLLYASVLVSNFVINAFAWDGNGVSSYFLAPVEPLTVIVGKNVAVWIFSVLLVVETTVSWIVMRGVPGAATLISGVLAFVATVLGLMITGNFTSVAFPVRRQISAANNSPSQTAVLIMLAVVVVNAVLTGTLILLADLVAGPWLRPVLLAGYVAALGVSYLAFLRPAAVLLYARRESLIAALEGNAD